MKYLLIVLSFLFFACEKGEDGYDRSQEWLVETQSQVRVHFYLKPDGSDKVSYDVLQRGDRRSFAKNGHLGNRNYYAIEVECLSSPCSYQVNGAPFSSTFVFDKSF